MPASRSVVSMLLRELGDFSLHPQGRPCGRPPPAAVLGRRNALARGGFSHASVSTIVAIRLAATPPRKLMTLSIRRLMEQITIGQIRIPAFQRGFVWDMDRVAYFIDSLYKRYPFGSLLLWRTRNQLPRRK
jgi:hypothetical protein